jgi:hypothetical protein
VQHDPNDVDGRTQQGRTHILQQFRNGPVGSNNVPVAVDDIGRERLLPFKSGVDNGADRIECRILIAAHLEHGGKARNSEREITIAERNLKLGHQAQQEIATGLRAAGFDEA